LLLRISSGVESIPAVDVTSSSVREHALPVKQKKIKKKRNSWQDMVLTGEAVYVTLPWQQNVWMTTNRQRH